MASSNGSILNGATQPKKLWIPPEEPNLSLPIYRFMEFVENKHNLKLKDFSIDDSIDTYGQLHAWSVKNSEDFWRDVWEFCELKSTQQSEVVIGNKDMTEVPKWFPDVKLNFAENLLARGADDDIAVCFAREDFDIRNGCVQKMTYAELRSEVHVYATSLTSAGVVVGDAVAGYMPNSIECLVAMLATASIGAYWCSTSPDFGPQAVLTRFSQVKPKVLFSVNAVVYKGKKHDHLQKLTAVTAELPSVTHTVVVPFVEGASPITDEALNNINKAVSLSSFLCRDRASKEPVHFEQVPFSHPLFVMFSSGTTGKPKCMVHSVGGTLLKHAEEHIIQNCTTKHDVLFFYTTCGWMMWNWLLSAIITGCTIVLFDGSPFEHGLNIMFDLADAVNMTAMGMGAACFEHYESQQLQPKTTHKLDHLRLFLSTGSPLPAHTFEYMINSIKHVQIASISGGTDIIGCFVGGTPMRPVYAGQCQCILLGMDVRCWDTNGSDVVDSGGELVCVQPFPSQPTHFLEDDDRKKITSAYFSRFPNVWTHGDFMSIDSHTNGITMLGRSDATLNPAGVRFGPAEIYSVVDKIDEIADTLAIGQLTEDNTERFVLFVKLVDGIQLNDDVIAKIKTTIRTQKTPKFLPAKLVQTPDIPYTSNGKKVEMAVRKILAGQQPDNVSALRNPECLAFFENWHSHNLV